MTYEKNCTMERRGPRRRVAGRSRPLPSQRLAASRRFKTQTEDADATELETDGS